jgi:MoaA/NifB/PqqE/SkfB family radical SAM enzyme
MSNPLWNLRLEISNYCNLKCPFCVRQRGIGNYKLNSKHLSLSDIKSWLPKSFLMFQTTKQVYLSGAIAEPTLNPECIEIVKYLSQICEIELDSNGSTNNEEWWYKLGNTKINCIFSPDSLLPSNNLYRINANTEKTISNIKSFVAGGGKACWKYIPFKHNEDELEEQRSIALKIGAVFSIVQPNPFNADDKVMPSKHFPNSNLVKDDLVNNQSPKYYCKLLGTGATNLLEISPDGILYPCCFSATSIFTVYANYYTNGDPSPNIEITPSMSERTKSFIKFMVPMIEKQGGIKSLSLYHNNIKDILKTDFYQFLLKNSWENGNEFCTKHCASRQYSFQ